MMADLNASGEHVGHKTGPGVKKAKKLSTRVDMTPMVDLGFLLITFFIFTTTMNTPSTMSLNMPKITRENDSMEIKGSNALTLLIGRETKEIRQVYYYPGLLKADGSNLESASFAEIRKVITDKRKMIMDRYQYDPSDSACRKLMMKAKDEGDPEWQKACADRDFVVLIKPSKEARYASIIDLMDEMTINGVKAFAIVDLSPQEFELIKTVERKMGFGK